MGASFSANAPEGSFSSIATGLTAPEFGYAAAVGTIVYFAPGGETKNSVGVLDTTTSTFSTIATGLPDTEKYRGAVALGDFVYMTPYDQDTVGVLDTTKTPSSTLNCWSPAIPGVSPGSTIGSSSSTQTSLDACKAYCLGFGSCVALVFRSGTGSCFALDRTYDANFQTYASGTDDAVVANYYGAGCTAHGTFSTIDTTAAGVTNTTKYWGAAAVGTKVYFGPLTENNVGVVDTSSSTFSTIADTTAAGVTSITKYRGATALGTKVYFTPSKEHNVGVLDTNTSTFSTIADTTAAGVTSIEKYRGAGAVIGTKIYFAPFNEHGVGVLDTVNSTFSTIDTSLYGAADTSKFNGAVAVGTNVYFVPEGTYHVGVLDTTSNNFWIIGTGSGSTPLNRFKGAVVVGSKVYLAPYEENDVGVLDTAFLPTVQVDVTISSPNTIGGLDQDAYRRALASELGITPREITLSVTSASGFLFVNATVDFGSDVSAGLAARSQPVIDAVSTAATTLTQSAIISDLLGVTVEGASTTGAVMIPDTPPLPPAPPSLPPAPPSPPPPPPAAVGRVEVCDAAVLASELLIKGDSFDLVLCSEDHDYAAYCSCGPNQAWNGQVLEVHDGLCLGPYCGTVDYEQLALPSTFIVQQGLTPASPEELNGDILTVEALPRGKRVLVRVTFNDPVTGAVRSRHVSGKAKVVNPGEGKRTHTSYQPYSTQGCGGPGQLDAAVAWCAARADRDQYSILDAGFEHRVLGVFLQTRPDNARYQHYVTKFRLWTSMKGTQGTWTQVYNLKGSPEFVGVGYGTEPTTRIFRALYTPIEARYVRIEPTEWHRGIELRWGLFAFADFLDL